MKKAVHHKMVPESNNGNLQIYTLTARHQQDFQPNQNIDPSNKFLLHHELPNIKPIHSQNLFNNIKLSRITANVTRCYIPLPHQITVSSDRTEHLGLMERNKKASQ